jgi:hypothetical protein
MVEMAKKIATFCALIGILFSAYLFVDNRYALAKKVDAQEISLKILTLENIIAKKEKLLAEALKESAHNTANAIREEIDKFKAQISILEEKALN